jgi:hypothetical protein
VHEAGLVDRLEPGEELGGDLAGLLERERAAPLQALGEGLAVDELHRDELLAVLGDEVEDAADVGGDDLACRAHLTAEQLARLLAVHLLGADGLERDVDAQLEVERAEDLAHAAAAEQLADLVALAEDAAGGQPMERGELARVGVVSVRGRLT